MKYHSTELLQDLFSRLLSVQGVANKLKLLTDEQWDNHEFPDSLPNWSFLSGICDNIIYVNRPIDRIVHLKLMDLLKYLFIRCPSGTGGPGLPVPSVVVDGSRIGYAASYQSMWGNHPYADNRRQIISECIDQLHTELQKRGYNVE